MSEKLEATKSFLFENVLAISAEYGKEWLKKEAIPLLTTEIAKKGGEILLDYGAGMIPGIGGAVSEYRTNKKIKNLEVMTQTMIKRNDELREKFENHSLENKEILDDIFEMVIEKIEATSQKEKIQFMINGYAEFLDVENPSFDVAYLYFDTLDKLTLLDIDVLKMSYHGTYAYFNQEADDYIGLKDYHEILDKYDIEYSQYDSIRQNLLRIGLLENEFDNKIEKDYKNVENAIKELRSVLSGLFSVVEGKKKMNSVKKLTSKSDLKFKAKDRLKVSKFGRDFVQYFLNEEE